MDQAKQEFKDLSPDMSTAKAEKKFKNAMRKAQDKNIQDTLESAEEIDDATITAAIDKCKEMGGKAGNCNKQVNRVKDNVIGNSLTACMKEKKDNSEDPEVCMNEIAANAEKIGSKDDLKASK